MSDKKEISGFLVAYFQPRTDRVLWSISDMDNLESKEIHSLQEDDYLIVYERSGDIRWEGRIHFEYSRKHSPTQEYWTRQIAFGHVVHGFQSNCAPEAWASMFFDKLPATLRRK